MILLILLSVWLFVGYTAWRIRYYSMLKYWHVTYNEDYRKWDRGGGERNALKHWTAYIPLIVIGGLISFIVIVPSEDYIIWNYKIPNS